MARLTAASRLSGALEGQLIRSSLEPAPPAVPAAPENKQNQYDDDEKCHRIHVCLLWSDRSPVADRPDKLPSIRITSLTISAMMAVAAATD